MHEFKPLKLLKKYNYEIVGAIGANIVIYSRINNVFNDYYWVFSDFIY